MSAHLHSYDGDIVAWANEQAQLLPGIAPCPLPMKPPGR